MGRYTRGRQALSGIREQGPDVALIDLGLPDLSGIEVLRTLAEQNKKTECLVLTANEDNHHLFAALQVGAVGYIVKSDISLEEIVRAIREVKQDEAPMSMGIARASSSSFSDFPDQQVLQTSRSSPPGNRDPGVYGERTDSQEGG